MNVLIGCEFSGIIRDEFIKKGHNAISCDLLETQSGKGKHYKGNIFDIINDGFDLGIFHPPCQFLTVSNNRSIKYGCKLYTAKEAVILREKAIEFFMRLTEAKIAKKAIENPVDIMSTLYRKPNQIIQPFQFGHPVTKATCLWLYNLPPLIPTKVMTKRKPLIWSMSPVPERSHLRSITYKGIARAMAMQWT